MKGPEDFFSCIFCYGTLYFAKGSFLYPRPTVYLLRRAVNAKKPRETRKGNPLNKNILNTVFNMRGDEY